MERFSGFGSVAVGTNETILSLFDVAATPASRKRIYDIVIGSAAAPADTATQFNVARNTAQGTEVSGFTPVALDPASPAAAADFGVAHSVEPTYTASKELMIIPLNQRATFRWVASPGSELLVPATQNNGIGVFSAASTGTAIHFVTMLFIE